MTRIATTTGSVMAPKIQITTCCRTPERNVRGRTLIAPTRIGTAATTAHEDADHDGVSNGLEQDRRPVPANLMPSLADAPRMHAVGMDDGCHALPDVEVPHVCSYYGTDTSRSLFLVGDSHALQWQPALMDIAKRHGWRLYMSTKSGCPIPTVTVYQRHVQALDCDAWRQAVFAAIEALRPDVVIATDRNDYHIAGGYEVASADNQRLWHDGMVTSLSRLKAAAGQVLLLGATPLWSRVIPRCLAHHLKNLRRARIAGVTPRAHVAARTTVLRQTRWVCRTGRRRVSSARTTRVRWSSTGSCSRATTTTSCRHSRRRCRVAWSGCCPQGRRPRGVDRDAQIEPTADPHAGPKDAGYPSVGLSTRTNPWPRYWRPHHNPEDPLLRATLSLLVRRILIAGCSWARSRLPAGPRSPRPRRQPRPSRRHRQLLRRSRQPDRPRPRRSPSRRIRTTICCRPTGRCTGVTPIPTTRTPMATDDGMARRTRTRTG